MLGCQSVLGLEEGQPACSAAAACEGSCGIVTDSCGQSRVCGGCPLWSKAFGDASDQGAVALSSFNLDVHAEHTTVIAGSFMGSIHFGAPEGEHVAESNPGTFVAAFGSSGEPLWSRDAPGTGLRRVSSVAIGQDGPDTFAYAAGNFNGYLTLGGPMLFGENYGDVFAAQYNAMTGEYIRSRRYGDPTPDTETQTAFSVVAGADGVFLLGNVGKTIEIGLNKLTSAYGGDVYLARFDLSMTPQWLMRLGGGIGHTQAKAMAAHPLGGVVATGEFLTNADFTNGNSASGCAPLSSAGGADIFIARIIDPSSPLSPSATGVCAWNIGIGDLGEDTSQSVAVDLEGSVLFAGQFEGEVSVGGSLHRSEGRRDALLVKLSADGLPLWTKRVGGVLGERITGVITDLDNNVIVVGYFAGSIDLGGGPLVSAGKRDIFVVKLDPDGGYLWSRRIGGPGDDMATCADLDHDGIVLSGSFDETLDFKDPSGPHTSAGGSDVFLAKISP